MSDKKKSAPKPADVNAPGPEKKSQEELNVAGLLEIVQAQADTIARHEKAQEDFADLVNDLRGRVEAQEEAGEPVERESDVFVDPFEDHDALVFKCDVIPPDSNWEFGRKLKWINPRLRDEIGMRGWEPVKLGDSFLLAEVKDIETGKVSEVAGAGLSKYLHAIPTRMEGSSRLDDHVRRGDLILCWIDMKIYIARMRRRDEDALKKRLMLSDEGDQYDVHGRRGAHVVGPGLTRGGDPRQRQSSKSRYMPENLSPEAGNLSKSAGYIPTTPTPTTRK